MQAIKIILDPVSQLTWAVRLVQRGDAYGLNDQLTHDKDEPLVEFFDTRYPHTPLGQFVSRYNLDTLLGSEGGINLDGGIPAWSVSAAGMAPVTAWLREVKAAPPVPTDAALLEALRRKVQQRAAQGELTLRAPYADNYWIVHVASDGTTRYDSYAEESRGPTGTLADLYPWELVGLLNL
jgi:hypothetical protein